MYKTSEADSDTERKGEERQGGARQGKGVKKYKVLDIK